jgi:N-acetylglutamate synthase-like GNAT family acetyltransferase
MSIVIRPAVARDDQIIKRIVRSARINPMDLNWRRFLVAEDDGQIIGVGQIRQHRDGSRELASIAVIPERERQGIASQIIRALIASEQGTLYLICRKPLETFYTRFGFRRASGDQLPPFFRRMQFFMRLGGGLVMKYDP